MGPPNAVSSSWERPSGVPPPHHGRSQRLVAQGRLMRAREKVRGSWWPPLSCRVYTQVDALRSHVNSSTKGCPGGRRNSRWSRPGTPGLSRRARLGGTLGSLPSPLHPALASHRLAGL